MKKFTLFLFSLMLFSGHFAHSGALFDSKISLIFEQLPGEESNPTCQMRSLDLKTGGQYLILFMTSQQFAKEQIPQPYKAHTDKDGIFLSNNNNLPFSFKFKDEGPLDAFVMIIIEAKSDTIIFMDFVAPLAKIIPWKSQIETYVTLLQPEKGIYLVRTQNLKKGTNQSLKVEVFDDEKTIIKSDINTNGESIMDLIFPLNEVKKGHNYKIELSIGDEKISSEFPNINLLKAI